MSDTPLPTTDGQIVTTPQTFSTPTEKPMGVAEASAAARALIASQGSAIAPEAPPAPAPAAPAQPRASDGTFGRQMPPAPSADAAPTTGQAPESAAPPAEGETPPEPDEAAQRVVPIELPDGNTLDLDVTDPVVADVIRTQFETAREADRIRTEAEETIEQVTQIREAIQIDPVGFVLRELRESAAGREHLALSLLTEPEMFTRLKPQLEAMLSDERNLEVARARQQAARAHFAEEARSRVQETREVQANLRDVQATCAAIARMLPNEVQQPTAYNDMLRDVMAYAEKADLLTVPPEHLPVILANRLTALGINPVEAATHAAKARSKKGAVTPPRATATAAPRPAGATMPPVPRSTPNGQQFVAAQQRRSAVAIPAAGAGSPNVGPDLVPPSKPDGSKMGVAETLAWHRAQVAKGKQGSVPLTR